MTSRDEIIKEIDACVDTYHAGVSDFVGLMDLRRNLAIWSYSLATCVRGDYESKAINYVLRKYQFAKQVVAAMDADIKAGGKRRPMNQIEAHVASLEHVKDQQKKEVEAEAQYEDTVARLKAVNNLLQAMSQELADMRQEKGNTHHQNQGI